MEIDAGSSKAKIKASSAAVEVTPSPPVLAQNNILSKLKISYSTSFLPHEFRHLQ